MEYRNFPINRTQRYQRQLFKETGQEWVTIQSLPGEYPLLHTGTLRDWYKRNYLDMRNRCIRKPVPSIVLVNKKEFEKWYQENSKYFIDKLSPSDGLHKRGSAPNKNIDRHLQRLERLEKHRELCGYGDEKL